MIRNSLTIIVNFFLHCLLISINPKRKNMVCHVGVDLTSRNAAVYDSLTKKCHKFKIVNLFEDGPDLNKICEFSEDEIYLAILVEIFEEVGKNKEFGCVCFFLNQEYSNEKRKKLVERGMFYGAQKILIVDDMKIAKYFAVISEMKYRPNEGDVIWIFDEFCIIIAKNFKGRMIHAGNYFGKSPWITNGQIEEIKKCTNINQNPNAIFYFNKRDIPFKENFPFCSFQFYSIQNYAIAALCIARIIGNDFKLIEFDFPASLNLSISIHIDDIPHEVLSSNEMLPIKKFLVIDEKMKSLKIYILDKLAAYKFADCKKFLVLVGFDQNKILSLKNMDISKCDESEISSLKSVLKVLPEPMKKVKISDVYSFPKKYDSINYNMDIIGIDLGTTRCCCAVNRRFAMETILLDGDKRLLPSFVAFDESHEKCGQVVVDRLRFHAKSTIFDAKRFIGKDFDPIKTDRSWPFNLRQFVIDEMEPENSEGFQTLKRSHRCFIKTTECGEAAFKLPEQISAILLKQIKEKAEDFQGKKLSDVVITVPAAFNDSQNKATILAGKFAGFETIHLLPEPVAAAFAYFIDRPIPSSSTILLFDLGGGTLDVCIFKIENSQLKIISRSGDPHLGGRDFDNLLIDYFETKLINDYNVEMSNDRKCRLMLKCQTIKEILSVMESAELDVDSIDPSMDAFIPITREEFEFLSSELIARIQENISKAFEKINLKVNQIHRVLQVGGACRMPMIMDLLRNVIPHADLCLDANPDEVVAVGAAYYSYHLNILNRDESKCSVM